MKTLANKISSKFETVKEYTTAQNIFIIVSGVSIFGLALYVAFASNYTTYFMN